MYIQDFSGDPADVIAEAFKSPKLSPKKAADIELAMREVGGVVAKRAQVALGKQVREVLTDAIAMYQINNGEYGAWPDSEEGERARDDYESGMDDAVEAALEPFKDMLSADWLGKSMIDTRVWDDTEDDQTITDNLAASAAKEMFKQLTYEKTPAQTLASAGILRADVETAFANRSASTGDAPMAEATDTAAVIEKICTHLGKGFDQMTVYEDLEMIIEEDDEVLAGSAGNRLGLNGAEMEVLQMAALDMEDAPSDLMELINAYKAPTVKQQRATKAEEKAEAAEAEPGLPASVFEALKECGASDTTMADQLGVSRSTYGNYTKGKTRLVADADQHAFLRDEVLKRANLMLGALAALDGDEPIWVE